MFHSLITRVTVAMITLLIAGVFIYTYFNVKRQQNLLIDTARENTELTLHTVENSIFNNMHLGNTQNINSILQLVGHHNQLLSMNLFHPHGIVLHSSNPINIGSKVTPYIYQLYKNNESYGIYKGSPSGDMLSMVKPIYNEVACHACHGSEVRVIGIMNVNYSLNRIETQILDSSRIFIYSSILITVFLSIMTSLILFVLVKKPLNKMTRTMSLIEQGDLSVRIDYDGKDEIGGLIASFNSMVDRLYVTRKELEQFHFEQLEHADRLASIGEMAAGIAHEIKNPLAGIFAVISVLKNEMQPDEPRASILGEVLEQVQRLDRTTNDLLFFGKQSLPELSVVDIEALLTKTIHFASQHQHGAIINQRLKHEGDLSPVCVDEKQIQQVFLNIILNAFQSMSVTGGTFLVSTSHSYHDDDIFVRIDFSDSGPGIPPQILERIFTPFFTTKAQGTGLGLPICLKLVRLHKGDISVVSDSSGTVFTVELPTCQLGSSETSEVRI